jgi:hypothetical protein
MAAEYAVRGWPGGESVAVDAHRRLAVSTVALGTRADEGCVLVDSGSSSSSHCTLGEAVSDPLHCMKVVGGGFTYRVFGLWTRRAWLL